MPEGWVRTILSVMADKIIGFLDTHVVPQGFLRGVQVPHGECNRLIY